MIMLLHKIQKETDENLKRQFAITYKFCNLDIHKFILILPKVFIYTIHRLEKIH